MTDKELLQQALEALKQAKDAVADWGLYASEYFQQKHDLQGDVDNIQAHMTALRERLARQEQLVVHSGWQPIETAPKDGAAILVMRDIWPGTDSGRAEECNGHNTYVAQWWDFRWVCYMDWIEDPRCPIEPTHWMPLPAPPKASLEARLKEKNA